MTGYSGTPQSKKLGIKPGSRVAFVDAPNGWALIDPSGYESPEFETVTGTAAADVIVAFVRSAAELALVIARLGERIFPSGSLWIAWPRKAAGHVSDVTDNVVRESVLPLGLVDVKVAAIDEDWSGLKIVWRLERRSGK
jgi:hypothetical protein